MGIIDRLRGKASEDKHRSAMSYNGKAILLSTIGGTLAAITAIFIPISLLETIAGASGLSEIIPAARPPLGSSARVLFVIFTAILVASILLVLLLNFGRKKESFDYDRDEALSADYEAKERKRMPIISSDEDIANKILEEDVDYDEDHQQSDESDVKKASIIGAILGGGAAVASNTKSMVSKLPFMGGDDSVRSFDDLPRLRNADSHPDAPPRRPLFANKDLGDQNLDDEDNVDETLQDIHEEEALSDSFDSVETFEVEEPHKDMDVSQPIYETASVQETIGSDVFESEKEDQDDYHIRYDEDITDDADIYESQDEAIAELPSYGSLLGRLENIVERRRAYKEELLNQEQPQNMEQSPDRKPIFNERNDQSPPRIQEPIDSEAQKIEAIAEVDEMHHNEYEQDSVSEDILTQPVNLKQVSLAEETSSKDDETSEGQTEEMDSALKAALETLHKMSEKNA